MTITKVYAADGVYIGCWFVLGRVVHAEDRWAAACQRETVGEAVGWMRRRYEASLRPVVHGEWTPGVSRSIRPAREHAA
jgi:hypothetical protein